MADTRTRIMEEALRLFGERGFAKTSVADIERAAGLTGGTGALYRHFRSKDQLLVEAVHACLTDWGPYAAFAAPDFSAAPGIEERMPGASMAEKIAALCRLGMIRADHIRDVRRILMRDNSVPPGVLDAFRADDHEVRVALVARTLRDFARTAGAAAIDEAELQTYAEVQVGAMAHLWLMRDIYGGDSPCGIDVDSYINATAAAIAARIHQIGGLQ